MPFLRAALRARASRVLAATGLLCASLVLVVSLANAEVIRAPLAHFAFPGTPPRLVAPDTAPTRQLWQSWDERREMEADIFEPASAMRRERSDSSPIFHALHGMCGDPAPVCERLVDGTSALGPMVCLAGNASCGDAHEWVGQPDERARFVSSRVEETERALTWSGETRVLVGFSRGAFVARDAAYHMSGTYSGLVLIGAAIVPDVDLLKKNGIRRVVLASGDYDGARPMMLKARAMLCAKGLPARFVSLGKVWHALPTDSGSRLADALLWVGERSDTPDPACTAERPRT